MTIKEIMRTAAAAKRSIEMQGTTLFAEVSQRQFMMTPQTSSNTIDINGSSRELVCIHGLWKSDRSRALALLSQFHAQLSGYAEDEMVDMVHLEKRMDRQNNTNGGGAPTSVWTSIVLAVEAGKVVEGRLSELYPHGVAVTTYDLPQGAVSEEVAEVDLQELVDANNKVNAQGQETAYAGKTWRQVVDGFLGQAMELAPGSPPPDGFVLVPITHYQPPMEKDGKYTMLDLHWRSFRSGTVLDEQALEDIGKHLKGFYCVLANEWVENPEDVLPQVLGDKVFQNEVSQLSLLIELNRRQS